MIFRVVVLGGFGGGDVVVNLLVEFRSRDGGAELVRNFFRYVDV